MNYINELLSNRILISGLVAWATAQILKTITYLVINKQLSFERLFGDGGMPSGHSATVTAVMLCTGFECGFNSPVFAVAAILAIIVMHDAMGVRLETGKQAKAINDMMEFMQKIGGKELTNEEKLKEFVGHTPLQVIMGCILGIIVAAVFNLV
ncbi:MAG: divergent PAP2 family protein [Eubacterium sp.]|nr:divergent PAP2 family protein [Eubacterium sp.]